MGNLRDQLKKANLISKKDAKRIAHEERVKRSKVGREGLEKEEEQRRAEIEAQRQATSEEDRAREAERAAERKDAEERAACEAILATEVAAPDRRGTIRWFFETEAGHLPWLQLDPSTMARLQSGVLCVARSGPPGTHVYGLLATEHARRVRALFPERIVWSAPGALGG